MKHLKNRSFRAARASRRRGFTLLEMVIVMGIIALILGGAMGLMKKIGSGGEMQRVTGDFSAIGSALDMYKINNGNYPTTSQGLKALVERPQTSPVPKRWTQLSDAVPLDPWQNEYLYKREGTKKPNEPELISKGPDKQEGTEDDLSNQD